MIQGNFKKWNRITVEDCLTFPVNFQRFQVATNACLLTHGIRLDHRKTFLVINFVHMIRPEIIVKEIHHSTTPGATGSVPVQIGTGTPVARDEDRIWGTIPMPTFARRPSAMSSLIPVDVPQMVLSPCALPTSDRVITRTPLHLLCDFLYELLMSRLSHFSSRFLFSTARFSQRRATIFMP